MTFPLQRLLVLTTLLGTLVIAVPAAAVGADPVSTASTNADYVLGEEAVKARDWDRAAQLLEMAARAEPNNADVQNLLGYTFRNQKKFELAFKHYQQALTLDPKHRGAHEYIGEAYVLTGNTAKATEHLVALERICGKNCEEYQELARAIAKR